MARPRCQQRPRQPAAAPSQSTEFELAAAEGVQAEDRRARKDAVEAAVRRSREQALARRSSSPTTSSRPIEAIIAAIDRKLTEQVNLIMHHEDFQKLEGAWRGLHYLVNNTETDETLKIRVMNISQEGPGQDPQEVQGHGLGPEPALQEDLRRGIRPVRRRALRLPGRRLLLRPHARPTSSCWARWRRSPPPRTRRSSPAPSPSLMQMECWQELANPRDLTKIFKTPEYAPLALAARVAKTPATSAWPCRASWRGYPTARRPIRSRSSTSRRTPTAPTTQVHLGERRLRDGDQHHPLLQAVRLVLPHPRRRIGRRGGRPAGRTPSRPTTAAWT